MYTLSNLHKALLKIEIEAHRSKQSSRTPKKNICLIVRAAHPRVHVWVRFLHLQDTHDLHIDQVPYYYEKATQWIFKAERQPDVRQECDYCIGQFYHGSTSARY